MEDLPYELKESILEKDPCKMVNFCKTNKYNLNLCTNVFKRFLYKIYPNKEDIINTFSNTLIIFLIRAICKYGTTHLFFKLGVNSDRNSLILYDLSKLIDIMPIGIYNVLENVLRDKNLQLFYILYDKYPNPRFSELLNDANTFKDTGILTERLTPVTEQAWFKRY